MRANLFFGAILAASATAAPTSTASSPAAALARRNDDNTSQPSSPFANWHATDFNWGSSPGGTAGTFNLAAEAGYFKGAPGFNVVCHPIMAQRGWTPCETPEGDDLAPENRVDVIWPSSPVQGRFYFGVAHIFQIAEGGSWVNATARTDIEAPPPREGASFELSVTHLAVGGTDPSSCGGH
ncbi:hypothetical protein ACRALDRAFT_1060000 [Sodiomyces alcalophilus JCM 7366]|uniref:uncharacterized protein n=1 Tax=Sodiomyces alcalophilus JCM 7366 TaxID=591952 RepID=UPI0039B505A8